MSKPTSMAEAIADNWLCYYRDCKLSPSILEARRYFKTARRRAKRREARRIIAAEVTA